MRPLKPLNLKNEGIMKKMIFLGVLFFVFFSFITMMGMEVVKTASSEESEEAIVAGKVQILKAINSGDVDFLRKVKDLDSNDVDYWGRPYLHCAILSGNLEVVKLLLEKKADLNTCFQGRTIFHCAGINGNYFILKLLLQNSKFGLNVWDDNGATPSILAAKNHNYSALVNIFAGGAGVNANEMICILEHAIKEKQLRIINFLMSNATERAWETVISRLEEVFFENDNSGLGVNEVLLFEACKSRAMKFVRRMLALGVDLRAVDHNGKTVLHWAVERLLESWHCTLERKYQEFLSASEEQEIVELLIENGADPKATDNAGKIALDLSAYVASERVERSSKLRVLKMVIKSSWKKVEDPRPGKISGMVTNAAVKGQSYPIFSAFLNSDAPSGNQGAFQKAAMQQQAYRTCWKRDKDGYTVLHGVAQNGFINHMQNLLSTTFKAMRAQNGVEIDVLSPEGWTPLHIACAEGNLAMVECLVKLGAKVDLVTKKGATPLHIAIRFDHFGVVEFLLKQEVCLKNVTVIADLEGWTALHWALYTDNEEIEDLVVKSVYEKPITGFGCLIM